MENINTISRFITEPVLNGNKFRIQFSEASKKRIDEGIKNGTCYVCVYNSLKEYINSITPSVYKYQQIDMADVCGSVTSIDYEDGEVVIALDSYTSSPDTHRYMSPDEYDMYQLKVRGLVNRTANVPMTDNTCIIEFIAFDLVKINKEETENDK